MSKEKPLNFTELVSLDRRQWEDNRLLSPLALKDFQRLCDEAFHSLRNKYYRPADLVLEMKLRRRFQEKVPSSAIPTIKLPKRVNEKPSKGRGS